MKKERKIEAPEGCEIEKVEVVDGVAVVTFREKERKLPKSWEEFCEMFPDYRGEYFIEPNNAENIGQVLELEGEKRTNKNAELLPDRATAEAILALCKLIQLRNCYNGDWVPDWTNCAEDKFVIDMYQGDVTTDSYNSAMSFLYFKTEELRDEFLRCFRPLIKQLKPLYGIKEGGEQ